MWINILMSTIAVAEVQFSDPVSFELNGTTNVINAPAMDSGWLPSGSALQIRLQLGIEQDAIVVGNGTTSVAWDSNASGELNLTAQGYGNSGQFSIQGIMDMLISVRFDIGAFSYEGVFVEQEVPLAGSTQFTPLTWETPVSTDVLGDGSEILDYTQSLLGILTGSLSGEVRPNCTASFTENYISTNTGDRLDINTNNLVFDSPVGSASLEVPVSHQSTINSTCAVQFIPALTISGPIIGTNTLEITQIDLPIIEQTTQLSIEPARWDFNLPSMSVESTGLAFETTDAGSSSNMELIVENIGYAQLNGRAELIDTSGSFELFGGEFALNPGTSSSLVVSFEGSDANQYYEAELVLYSNDPSQPVVALPLSATTSPEVTDPDSEADTDGYTVSDGVEKPSCSSVDASSMWLMTLAILGIRRRH